MAIALVRWPRKSADAILPLMPPRAPTTPDRGPDRGNTGVAAATPRTPVHYPHGSAVTNESPTSDASESPTSEGSDDEPVCIGLYSTPLAEDKVIFFSRI